MKCIVFVPEFPVDSVSLCFCEKDESRVFSVSCREKVFSGRAGIVLQYGAR